MPHALTALRARSPRPQRRGRRRERVLLISIDDARALAGAGGRWEERGGTVPLGKRKGSEARRGEGIDGMGAGC